MDVTAIDAKNRSGQLPAHALPEPVFIENERADPGREFYEKYKGWVDAQNALVEKYGIPGEEFRAW